MDASNVGGRVKASNETVRFTQRMDSNVTDMSDKLMVFAGLSAYLDEQVIYK